MTDLLRLNALVVLYHTTRPFWSLSIDELRARRIAKSLYPEVASW